MIRHRKTIFWLLVFLVLFLFPQSAVAQQDSTHLNSPSPQAAIHYIVGNPNAAQKPGLEGVRTQNDLVITFPNDKADEIWKYLKDKYSTHNEFLKQKFPGYNFTVAIEEDNFSDDYFDNNNLDLFNKQNSVRHRFRTSLTNPDDRKSGRELMQMKLSHDVNNAIVRDQLKWNLTIKTNQGKNIATPEDASALISLIKPNQRTDFENAVYKLAIDPFKLKKILTIQQRRRRLYVSWEGQSIVTLSVDEGTSKLLWSTAKFSEMEQQLSEIAYTQADNATQKAEIEIRAAIVDDLQQKFPFIKRSGEPKYNTVFNFFEKRIPFLRTLIKWNLL